jgi:hypothetical protein
MVLRQRVFVADVRIIDAVQRHVHAADAQHGVIEVVTVKHVVVEMFAADGIAQDFRMLFAQIFARGHQKTASAAGRVANHVLGVGCCQFHHQPDDVARGAELAVLPGAGDLAEHVFVQVALGVAVFHRHMVEHVHHLGQQRRSGDGEACILHVVGVGGIVAAHYAQEWKNVFADDGEHFSGCEMFKTGPTQVVVVAVPGIITFREDASIHRFA